MIDIYIDGGAIVIDGLSDDLVIINPANFDWRPSSTDYYVRDNIDKQTYSLGLLANIQSNGVAFDTDADLIEFLNSLVNTTGRNSTDVFIQDQVTPVVITQMARTISETTMAVAGVIDDISIEVVNVADVIKGTYIVVFNPTTNRFYQGKALAVPVGNVILLDSPLDQPLGIGNIVAKASTNMAVDGSVTPKIFQFRGDQTTPIAVTVDVTRIIITMQLTSAGDLSDFGNIARLIKGILFRRIDGVSQNIFNAKDNREISNLGYDFEFLVAAGNSPDGLSSRITFAGQNKMGVALRVAPGENLQMIIQDNLASGVPDITVFEMTVEGHVVDY